MNAARRMILAGTAALVVLFACEDPSGNEEPCPRETPGLGLPADAAFPDTLESCSGRYILECFLWRDFMPISPPNGNPLRAIATLTEIDATPIPESVALDHLWVFNSLAFWSTDFSEDAMPPVPPYQLARIARCGPKWEPGILVDVVVSVRCGADWQYVKAKDIVIRRTF